MVCVRTANNVLKILMHPIVIACSVLL